MMDQANCKNMVSNLPLLFTGGYPTSLDKITELQLEKFIPFMVQCSLGFIQIAPSEEYSEPEWWPGDLDFTIPFQRPSTFIGNWLEKMRELVVICYSFHKCVFLLRFCTDLATYEPATLRFINNYNSTTSLYERRTNKLLVTFRNENMLYDQPQQTSNRKSLLPKSSSSLQLDSQQEQMVEPAFFDIYLCDDCDAELYSYDAYLDHEKACHIPKISPDVDADDDVIFCGEDILPYPIISGNSTANCREKNMSAFLLNFNLLNRKNPAPVKITQANAEASSYTNVNIYEDSARKLRRITRRTRGTVTLSKCTSIPLSSPCGQFLLKSIKTIMSKDYQIERLERIERFCHAPPLIKEGAVVTNRPKWMLKNKMNTNVLISHKRVLEDQVSCHDYKFPRRQLSKKCKKRNFRFYNKLLLKKCKPCAIILERLTVQDIENRNINKRLENVRFSGQMVSENALKTNSSKEHIIIDCIDLCSSDEEECCSDFSQKEQNYTWNNVYPVHDNQFNETKPCNLNFSGSVCPAVSKSHNINEPHCNTFGSSLHICSKTDSFTVEEKTTEERKIVESNRITLSAVENLSQVKENRVNDWLNTATVPDNSIHMQPHILISTMSETPSLSSSTVVTNNNSSIASNPLPPVQTKNQKIYIDSRCLEQQ